MGNVHMAQYAKMPDVEVVLYDRSEERRQRFADRWNVRTVANEAELLASVDVVDVCLPTDLHKDACLRAIAAGKPVFCEKPLARTLEDAEAIRNASMAANMPVMPGQVVRFFPEFAQAHRAVKRGDVGRPAVTRIRRGGLAPSGSKNWFMDHSRSGGVLLDLAIHDFDWLRWTLGPVATVYSRTVGAQTGTGPDYGLTTLTFASGALAHTESTWMDPAGFRVTLEVAGSDGLLQFDSRENPAYRISAQTSDTTADHLKVAESPLLPTDDPYYQELHAFLTAVRTGQPVPVTVDDGIEALRISLAALESARTGRAISLA